MTASHRPVTLMTSLLLLLLLSASVFGAQDQVVDAKPKTETAAQSAGSTQTEIITNKEASPPMDPVAGETASSDSESKESFIDRIASRPLVNGKASLAPVSPQGGSSDDWHFAFTPYILLGSMKGQVGPENRVANIDARFKDILDDFNFGFMAVFDARKKRFLFFTDFLYLNLANTVETPGPLFSSVRADIKTTMVQPAVGVALVNGGGSALDLYGGIRYWYLSTNIEFRPGLLPGGTVDVNQQWVDAIGGLRGRGKLSDKWYLVGFADLGGGGSDFTYQFFGGVSLSLNKRMTFIVGYRYLDVNYRKDGFVYDTALRGPVIGGSFRF